MRPSTETAYSPAGKAGERQPNLVRAAGPILERELHAREIVRDDDRLRRCERAVIERKVPALRIADDVEA